MWSPPSSILIKRRCPWPPPLDTLARPFLIYCTIMCGAESSTVTVAIIVNSVKTIKQNRSTTIAANFQSLIRSASSSRFFMRPVMNWSSFRIKCKSLCEHPLIECSSTVVGRLKLGEGEKDRFYYFIPRVLVQKGINKDIPSPFYSCILLAEARSNAGCSS